MHVAFMNMHLRTRKRSALFGSENALLNQQKFFEQKLRIVTCAEMFEKLEMNV